MMVSFRNFTRIHMVGIGGIGMSGIAEVLLTLGYSVSGSDTKPSTITERLQDLGATIFEEHRTENVEGAHVVVISSRRDHDDVCPFDVFGSVLFENRGAQILQPFRNCRGLRVRTGHRITQREQHFCDPAHADPADSHHVNARKIAKRYHHVPSAFFGLARRAAPSIRFTISRAALGWARPRAFVESRSMSPGWSRREKISCFNRSAVSSGSGISRPAPRFTISCAFRI